jgi:acyl-CoA thioesterase-1
LFAATGHRLEANFPTEERVERGRLPASLVLLAALLLGAAPSDGPVVLCLGDSLTEGQGVAPEQAWPSVLERRLRASGHPGARVVNAGISGSTSASAVSRLKWQLRAQPDLLILALGANDGLRGVDVAATRRNLDEAIRLARDAGVRVVLAGMQLPPNYGPAYTRDFRALFVDLAKQHEIALIPFLLEGVAARPELNLADGIHPNARGYERVAENVFDVLKPLL